MTPTSNFQTAEAMQNEKCDLFEEETEREISLISE
jgi:hypothetical protein